MAAAAVMSAGLVLPALAQSVVVSTIPGQGWVVDPSNPAGGTERVVEGPATPPAGRGSLELAVQDVAARALLSNDLGLVARPFGDLSGSWSTYVLPGANAASTAPTLRFPSFQDATVPAGFTTVSIEPFRQGTVVADQWQTWTVGPSSVVWQTNVTDGFCVLATPCSLAEFVAQYPNAAWGAVQLGIGTGVVGPVASYADAVELSAGGATFEFDFEVPLDQRSTATIGAVEAAATGGTVPVTLTASALAVTPVTFTLLVGGVPQETTLAAGETVTIPVAVPFGTTPISVTAQGAEIASAEITVAQATTSTGAAASPAPPGVPPGSPGATLPATGRGSTGLGGVGIGLVVAGSLALAAAALRVRRSAT